MEMAGAWGMSFKIGEELPDGDEQCKDDAWEGEYENGLYEEHNGGFGHS